MATAKFQHWVATQIWGGDKQGARRTGQGRGANDLGQTRRGRDVQLVSRLGLEGLALRHPFWCCDLVEIGLGSLRSRLGSGVAA